MLYIQLAENYKSYDRVRILDIHFTSTPSDVLNFSYEVCKKTGNIYEGLFSKNIMISEPDEMDSMSSINADSALGIWDAICKILLQYLVIKRIEFGTVEKE